MEGQEPFESVLDLDYWDVDNSVSTASGGTAQQCLGIAKSTGNQCRNKTNNESGFCYLHEPQVGGDKKVEQRLSTSVQCTGTTQ